MNLPALAIPFPMSQTAWKQSSCPTMACCLAVGGNGWIASDRSIARLAEFAPVIEIAMDERLLFRSRSSLQLCLAPARSGKNRTNFRQKQCEGRIKRSRAAGLKVHWDWPDASFSFGTRTAWSEVQLIDLFRIEPK